MLSAYGFLLPGALNEADYIEVFEDFDDLVDAVKTFIAEEESDVANAGEDIAEFEGSADNAALVEQLAARLSVLEELDASAAPLAIRPGAPEASAHLLSCAAYLLASEDQASLFEESFSPAAGHFTLQPPILGMKEQGKTSSSAQGQHPLMGEDWPSLLEKRARAVVATRCQQRLEAAPTTAAEDEATLANTLRSKLPSADNSGCSYDSEETARRRALLALEYRLNVKQLLGKWSEVPGYARS